MSSFFAGIKSFMHSISTSDHYAAYDPDRPAVGTGSQDTARLRAGGGAEEDDEFPATSRRASSTDLTGGYAMGRRSQQLNANKRVVSGASAAAAGAGTGSGPGTGIALADMAAEGPPVPSPELSWERIDRWVERNYPELYDQLLEPATENDVAEVEHDLDCSLPQDVRESMLVHDGQERGGRPTGLFYGITLLDLESLSEEWTVWRNTAIRLNEIRRRRQPAQSQAQAHAQSPLHQGAGPSSKPSPAASAASNQFGGAAWFERQASFPPGAVQTVYAHPSWVPLAKDFDGNNIAVDLAPGPRGRYGQVILFGREFDTKYVVASSWGDFLAQFAADLESGAFYVDDSSIEDPIFAYKLPSGRLASYFTVLRQRAERVYSAQRPTSVVSKPGLPRTVSSTSASASEAGTSRIVSPAASTTNLAEETVMKLTPKDSQKQTKTVIVTQESEESEPESHVETETETETETKAKQTPITPASEPIAKPTEKETSKSENVEKENIAPAPESKASKKRKNKRKNAKDQADTLAELSPQSEPPTTELQDVEL